MQRKRRKRQGIRMCYGRIIEEGERACRRHMKRMTGRELPKKIIKRESS